jgi:hypothetical protein
MKQLASMLLLVKGGATCAQRWVGQLLTGLEREEPRERAAVCIQAACKYREKLPNAASQCIHAARGYDVRCIFSLGMLPTPIVY